MNLVWAPSRIKDLPETRAMFARWIRRHGDTWYRNQDITHGVEAAGEMADAVNFGALATMTAVAPPYWVTAEMSALVSTARRSYEPVRDVQPMTPSGFAYFEAPLAFVDTDGFTRHLAGFVWTENVAAYPIQVEDRRLGLGMPVVAGGPHFGGSHPAMLYAVAMLQTFWILAAQRLAVTTTHRPDRAARRRCTRLGVEDGDVQVIDLRRMAHAPSIPAGTVVDWSHRWMVDGHWRNQYFPSEDVHRPLWIAPHVKGPEDKPLVVREKVYRWRR